MGQSGNRGRCIYLGSGSATLRRRPAPTGTEWNSRRENREVSGREASTLLARSMTKSRIGTRVLILTVFAIAVVVLVGRRPPSPASSVHPTASVMSSVRESRAAPAEAAPSIPAMAGGLWVRPAPEVAALHARRAGFSWILKQLGASDELVTRLIDGHLAAAITELKKEASAGDPAAINILGEIAHQQCRLGRDAPASRSWYFPISGFLPWAVPWDLESALIPRVSHSDLEAKWALWNGSTRICLRSA
jgi:hypothetical protein